MPKTEYQANLRLLDLSPPEQFIIDFCSNQESEVVEVFNKDFYELFQIYISENNIEYNTNPLKFGVKIKNLNIDGIEFGKHTKKGDSKNYNIAKIQKHFKITNDPFEEDNIITKPINNTTTTEPTIKILKTTTKTKSNKTSDSNNCFNIDFNIDQSL